MTETGGAASADIDGDGKTELIVCGNGALLWYRPSTGEKGLVALGHFAVGVAVRDLDGDGHMEILAELIRLQREAWRSGSFPGTSLAEAFRIRGLNSCSIATLRVIRMI